MSNLSRRTLVSSAVALPALTLPALASTAIPASACTLPPDLIERFVRVRAWYLDSHQQEALWNDEIDRRFYAATGFTHDQWRDVDHDHPRWKELKAAFEKVCAEVPGEDDAETNLLGDERWDVAEAIIDHKPQTVVDLAWQAEAYLLADLDLFSFAPNSSTGDRLIRTFFRHIRTLGALPQPDDPLGALSIDMDSDEAVQS
jgi:hypothetical protein